MSQRQDPGSASNHGHPADPPPAYTENVLPSVRPVSMSSPAQAVIHDSAARLTNGIPELLALARDERMGDEDREAGEVLLSLSSHAADFLADVGSALSGSRNGRQRAPLKRFEAELYMVPEGAFTETGWHSSGAEDRAKQGVHIREARVKLPTEEKTSKAISDGFWSTGRDEKLFTNFGDSVVPGSPKHLWWDSEFEAHRFAQYLDAECKSSSMGPMTARASSLRSFPALLSRTEINREVNGHAASSIPSDGRGKSIDTAAGSVQITTRAEKMTFRRENEMGLWESKSGWTIILYVAIAW